MSETVTVRGFIGNDVRTITTEKGLPISTFRLASTPRRFDRERGEWVDGDTNWFTVTCFRALAQNARTTLSKGDPVLVTGRLKVRQWTNDTGQRGTAVEIEAEGLGHDLTFGTGSFTRLGGPASEPSSGGGSAPSPTAPAEDPQGASDATGSDLGTPAGDDPTSPAGSAGSAGSTASAATSWDADLSDSPSTEAPF
ncbi:single-stranded DNA-binding protein [Nesterenkonia suensis]